MTKYKDTFVSNALLKALLELLKTKQLNEIRIIDLTNYAQISRASFYRHFSSIEDILTTYATFITDEFIEHNQNLPNENIVTFLFNLSQHCYKYEDFYIIIFNQNIPNRIISIIKNYLNSFSEINDKIDTYRLNAIAYGIYGWLETWVKDGMELSPDELLESMKNHHLNKFYNH